MTGATTSDRMSPRVAGISFQRHDSPLKSGRVPDAAAGTANWPAFIARSAHASPPPMNIANETFFDGPNRATSTLWPAAFTADTGTSAARSSSSKSSRVHAAVAASAARAQVGIACRDRETGAIAAEYERKLASVERIGDCGDDRCALRYSPPCSGRPRWPGWSLQHRSGRSANRPAAADSAQGP